jgi:UDP-N-acetylmuramyl pentapeptide phosphotransferase/UDP-N-acetylglucosamine-1-phosphate transferase
MDLRLPEALAGLALLIGGSAALFGVMAGIVLLAKPFLQSELGVVIFCVVLFGLIGWAYNKYDAKNPPPVIK